MYLTPARFREMGLGLDLANVEDSELRSLIHRASAVVDAFCNVPRIPQRHDFRGGDITGEQHNWRIPSYTLEMGQRRYYPYHRPVREITQFRIYVTNTQYVEIAPTELLINHTEGYWEVVSLAVTSSGLYNALIVPNVGLATPVAKANYSYGWEMAVDDEELVWSDGQTWRAQNQFWFSDADHTPVIKKNGVEETTGFTIDSNEGTVTFDGNLLATDVVSASYSHRLPNEIQWGTAHVAAYFRGSDELHQRGMAHLKTLRVEEVQMTAFDRPTSTSTAQNLWSLAPDAAALLESYAADNITVR